MEKVQFEEPSIGAWQPRPAEPKGLTGFLIKNGWAKDLSQANLFLIALVALSAAFIAFYWKGGDEAKLVPDADIVNRSQFLP